MNIKRRKELQEICTIIVEARERIETVRDDEEEYKDNMPENFWGSERYEKAENAVDALESAISSLEEVLEYIEEAQE